MSQNLSSSPDQAEHAEPSILASGDNEETTDREYGLDAPRGDPNTTRTPRTKERNQPDNDENGPGAHQINERAPNINIRFFRRIPRRTRSERARIREARNREIRGEISAEAQGEEPCRNSQHNTRASACSSQNNGTRRSRGNRSSARSTILQNLTRAFESDKDFVVSATAVEEGEVFEAERMGFWNRNVKLLALGFCCMFVLVGVLSAAFLVEFTGNHGNDEDKAETVAPSMSPSSMPSFDLRPTLEVVRSRGYFRCGVPIENPAHHLVTRLGASIFLCKVVSAVIFGNVYGFEAISIPSSDNFISLQNRNIDLLASLEHHSFEREVVEETTKSGFAFSSTYYYADIVYVGRNDFVDCAYARKRYGKCANLSICVRESSSHATQVKSLFPSTFFLTTHNSTDLFDKLLDGDCNVVVASKTQILVSSLHERVKSGEFVVGNTSVAKAPFAVVSRNDDKQWSDIINWSIQAMFFGEEHRLTKNLTLCTNDTAPYPNALNLRFLNAVFCNGNYADFLNKGLASLNVTATEINSINRGTGMMYAIPFGDLTPEVESSLGPEPDSAFVKIIERGKLKCGITVPDGYSKNLSESRELIGMNLDYCRTLAAATFQGDTRAAEFVVFPENDESSFIALLNGDVDVLAGSRVSLHHDISGLYFESGVSFSTPYFYGDTILSGENLGVYCFATREDDELFSSFVNAVVGATIFAGEEGITREASDNMPIVSLFGLDLRWSFKDAIARNGNYNEIFLKNFNDTIGDNDGRLRGRNQLNINGNNPQILPFPGLEFYLPT